MAAITGLVLTRAMVVLAGCAAGLPMLLASSALGQVRQGQERAPAAAAASEAGGAEQPQTELPIRRITLYRSGVGFFERSGTVDGQASVSLRFNVDQVNDILKSLVLLDLDGGRVDTVGYGSKEPLERRLASFGINIADNPSMPELLGRLRGTRVRVATAEGPITGTVFGVETRQRWVESEYIEEAFVNLLTENGFASISVRDVRSMQILDEELAAELNKALAALAEYRADRTKSVDLSFSGQGARRVVVGYVHEMPVWKTSYRLVLPDESGGRPTMQGWAIVENTTDQDWNNVRLSLVSGRPVSFRMDLYEPLYTVRPELPVPTVPGVAPRQYAQGASERLREMMDSADEPSEDSMGARLSRRGVVSAPAMSAAPEPGREGALQQAGQGGGRAKSSFGELGQSWADYAPGAQASAGLVGEVFQYEIDAPVTIERQRSAMIPILSSAVTGRRVSIYNSGDNPNHPMRGVQLTNDTGLQILPGPLAVFDGSAYAGDAALGHVTTGEKRLLSYAIDLDVAVLRRDESTSEVTSLRIVDGMFEQRVKSVQKTTYGFENKDAARGRTILVEHPRYEGWDLVRPDKPAEETQSLYRFEVEAPAGGAASLEVVQERVEFQRVGVMNYELPMIVEMHRSGRVSDEVLAAVREIARRQSEISTIESRIQEYQRQINAISQDQSRIRENMGRIDRTTDLYARYMTKLTQQESQLEDLTQSLDSAQQELEEKRRALNDYLRGLRID